MVTIYIEGGGDSAQLKARCRKGFSRFFEKMGFKGRMPKLVACGSRRNAYEQFCTAIQQGKNALLLVDSEAPVSQLEPWLHLAQREGNSWKQPPQATAESCHLMVECMENWFLADIAALQRFYGQDFSAGKFPAISGGIEKIRKHSLMQSLKQATQTCRKGSYSKGDHSFALLEQIDPAKVVQHSPWAKRLETELNKRLTN